MPARLGMAAAEGLHLGSGMGLAGAAMSARAAAHGAAQAKVPRLAGCDPPSPPHPAIATVRDAAGADRSQNGPMPIRSKVVSAISSAVRDRRTT